MKFSLDNLKTNTDHRGSLVALEGMEEIPFSIERVFYIYGNHDLKPRAGHANKTTEEYIISLNGCCSISLNDGREESSFTLDKPNIGLYITGGIWVEIDDFSRDCILLVLASKKYDKEDQICDYEKFKEISK